MPVTDLLTFTDKVVLAVIVLILPKIVRQVRIFATLTLDEAGRFRLAGTAITLNTTLILLSAVVMKPTHLLLVSCGTEISLKGMRESMFSGVYETAELSVSNPPSDRETDQISEAIAASSPGLIFLFLSGGPVVEVSTIFFGAARRNKWHVPIVTVCPTAKPMEVTELFRLGAADVVTTPIRSAEWIPRLLAVHASAHQEESRVAQLRVALGLEQVIGESPAFVALLKSIPRIAKYDVSVLIVGETGTGKEVLARAIHYCSLRSGKPFIPVNCGAIPVELLENEFFGHESGAFTSANCPRRGVIKEADGGTLFLDEVDSLPTLAQVKLLRFLQDGQFRPLGSASVCTADVRIIAASNVNFTESVNSGRFRRDLYYRLNVVSLKLPPLREREDDIILLARYFLAKYSDKFFSGDRAISSAALEKLVRHNWPGNVRELENVIQRALVLAEKAVVQPEDIFIGDTESGPENQTFRQLKAKAINQFEQSYVRRLLLVHDGNITKAAQSAGKDRRAFWELMRKHHITRSSFPGAG